MKNFEKSDIISDVAYKKNKTRFLSRAEQMRLNQQMKDKLVCFAREMAAEKSRPETMTLFDEMMNGMHGQRVKDLYAFRREGKHVMALLCNSIPPELIYAMGDFVPVSVCMGAGEVEPYADEYTKGMCTLSRSMIGFLNTGMCVFFNLADYVLASDLCPSIGKASEIVSQISDDFDVYSIKTNKFENQSVHVDFDAFYEWVKKITGGVGIDREKLREYAKLFSGIRAEYRSVLGFRKHRNPPINGKNSLWIQQLALVEEPHKLLEALKKLRLELKNRVEKNIGYDFTGQKKRVMLITPRIMPPFGEIYRLIENTGALIVCEEMDMGITNIDYKIDDFLEMMNGQSDLKDPVKYMLESIDLNSSSCMSGFDFERLKRKIENYKVDAVINYSFRSCPVMKGKTKMINKLLNEIGVSSMVLETDYMENYEKEKVYIEEISSFLNDKTLDYVHTKKSG
jgi:benzoyl-CoA reductase/2-hydroxyglutaryl-CoA dehydratase subunit BcrC/BadD/HgdB